MRKDVFDLGGRDCWLFTNSDAPEHLIIMPGNGFDETVQEVCRLAERSMNEQNGFVAAGFNSDDWDSEFSPWQADAAFKNSKPFGGEGGKTLGWVLNSFIPEVISRANCPGDTSRSIMGYSLAGLFALWAFLENDMFVSCACCSGSLWFDKWLEYAENKHIGQNRRLYLSLGDKEEKTRNPKMSKVFDVTKKLFNIYKSEGGEGKVVFEMNAGGHFRVYSR